jgi:hypothetical protein
MIRIAIKTTGMATGVELNVSSTNRYFNQLRRVILSAGKAAARTTLIITSGVFRQQLRQGAYPMAPLSPRWVKAKGRAGFDLGVLKMTRTYINSWRVRNATGLYQSIFGRVYAAYACYPVGLATETRVSGSRIVSFRRGPMTNQIKGLILEGLITKKGIPPRPHLIHLVKLVRIVMPKAFNTALRAAVSRSLRGLHVAPAKVTSMLTKIVP